MRERGQSQPHRVPTLAGLTLFAALIPWAQLATGVIVVRGDAALTCLYLVGFALAQIVGYRAVGIWGLERPLAAFSWVVLAGTTRERLPSVGSEV